MKLRSIVDAYRTYSWRGAAWLVVVATITCVAAVAWFITAAMEKPRLKTECTDRYGVYRRPSQAYEDCIDTKAQKFLKGDFAESKDLGKAFLTLLTAVFVGSITFSEKIVNLQKAGPGARNSMISAWGLFLLAIVACGCGLAFIALSAGMATYYPNFNYWRHELRAIVMFVVSGVAFGGGLVALLVAGILTLFSARTSAVAADPPPMIEGANQGEAG